jgi:hypothetical protein
VILKDWNTLVKAEPAQARRALRDVGVSAIQVSKSAFGWGYRIEGSLAKVISGLFAANIRVPADEVDFADGQVTYLVCPRRATKTGPLAFRGPRVQARRFTGRVVPLPLRSAPVIIDGAGASLLPSPVLQGEILQSNIWKPGPASARERNQFGEVLVQRLDSALGHEAEYCFPDS